MTPKKLVRLISGKTMSTRREEGEEVEGSTSPSNHKRDYTVATPRERLKSSRGKQFDRMVNELNQESSQREFCREGFFNGIVDLYHGLAIHPDNNRYNIFYFIATLF